MCERCTWSRTIPQPLLNLAATTIRRIRLRLLASVAGDIRSSGLGVHPVRRLRPDRAVHACPCVEHVASSAPELSARRGALAGAGVNMPNCRLSEAIKAAGTDPTKCRGHEKSRRRPTLAWAGPTLPSAMEPLTSVFGMGTGMTTPLWPPAKGRKSRELRRIATRYEGGKLSR